jgi:hypothetical protein
LQFFIIRFSVLLVVIIDTIAKTIETRPTIIEMIANASSIKALLMDFD